MGSDDGERSETERSRAPSTTPSQSTVAPSLAMPPPVRPSSVAARQAVYQQVRAFDVDAAASVLSSVPGFEASVVAGGPFASYFGKKCYGCGILVGSQPQSRFFAGPDGKVQWTFYKILKVSGLRVAVNCWCKACSGTFIVKWAFMFPATGKDLTLKDQLANFGIFLKQNPAKHQIHRACVKVRIAQHENGKTLYRKELLYQIVVHKECISEPKEALIEIPTFKELVELDVFDEKRLQCVRPVETETVGGNTTKLIRAQWEAWMEGRRGILPFQRSREVQKCWKYDLAKGLQLEPDMVKTQMEWEQAQQSTAQARPICTMAKYREIIESGIEADHVADGALPEGTEQEEEEFIDSDLDDMLDKTGELDQGKEKRKGKKEAALVAQHCDSLEEEYIANAEVVEASFMENQWLRTSWRSVPSIRQKNPWRHCDSLYKEMSPVTDAKVLAVHSHLELMYQLMKATSKILGLNLKKPAGSLSLQGQADIQSLIAQFTNYARAGHKTTREYLLMLYQAISALQLHQSQSVEQSFRYVMVSTGDLGFASLCDSMGYCTEQLAYGIAHFLLKRYLPADFSKDRTDSGGIDRTTEVCNQIMAVIDEPGANNPVSLSNTSLYREICMCLDVLLHRGDLPKLVDKFDCCKNDSDTYMILATLTQRGVGKTMRDRLVDASEKFKSSEALDSVAGLVNSSELLTSEMSVWLPSRFGDSIAKGLGADLDKIKALSPYINQLVKGKHADSASLNEKVHDIIFGLQICTSARAIQQEGDCGVAMRVSVPIVQESFSLPRRLQAPAKDNTLLPITEGEVVAFVEASLVKEDDTSFEAAIALSKPAKCMDAVAELAATSIAWSQQRSLEFDAVDKLLERATERVAFFSAEVVKRRSPLAGQLRAKFAKIPSVAIADLTFDGSTPGIGQAMRKQLANFDKGTFIKTSDEMRPFLAFDEVRTELGDDALAMEAVLCVSSVLATFASFEDAGEQCQKHGDRSKAELFGTAKEARSLASKLLVEPQFRRIANDPKYKHLKPFFTNYRNWILENCGEFLETHLVDTEPLLKVVNIKIPKTFDALFAETDAATCFTAKKNKSLWSGLLNYASKSEVVSAVGDLATIEAAFNADLALSGFTLDMMPELQTKFQEVSAVLKKGRKAIVFHQCLKPVLDQNKDFLFHASFRLGTLAAPKQTCSS